MVRQDTGHASPLPSLKAVDWRLSASGIRRLNFGGKVLRESAQSFLPVLRFLAAIRTSPSRSAAQTPVVPLRLQPGSWPIRLSPSLNFLERPFLGPLGRDVGLRPAYAWNSRQTAPDAASKCLTDYFLLRGATRSCAHLQPRSVDSLSASSYQRTPLYAR